MEQQRKDQLAEVAKKLAKWVLMDYYIKENSGLSEEEYGYLYKKLEELADSITPDIVIGGLETILYEMEKKKKNEQ